MPLFGWARWPKRGPGQAAGRPGPDAVTRTLLRELRWQLKERERLAREMEDEQRAWRTGADYGWLRAQQSPPGAIPATDQRQLEALCAQVAPCQAGPVLSRFREVLAENDVLPWEIVHIFKQVLAEVLSGAGKGGQHAGPGRPQGAKAPAGQASAGARPQGPGTDEIPTVSSYVDRVAEASFPARPLRAWSPPQRPAEGPGTGDAVASPRQRCPRKDGPSQGTRGSRHQTGR